MDLTNLWHHSANYDPSDVLSLREENDRLRRVLCSLTREHVNTKKELDATKVALGYYKVPFLFLQLPREVRDQVYGYALLAMESIKPEPRPIEELSLESVPWKPPTPGLSLVSRQLHLESNEVLYSKNIFHFDKPGDLIWFEDQIGRTNRDLVRRLELSITPTDAPRLGIDLIAPCDYGAEPEYWARTLMKSGLKNIIEMRIMVLGSACLDLDTDTMPSRLQLAIKDVFGRGQNQTLPPLLLLEGFCCVDRELFPENWHVEFDDWRGLHDKYSIHSLEWPDEEDTVSVTYSE